MNTRTRIEKLERERPNVGSVIVLEDLGGRYQRPGSQLITEIAGPDVVAILPPIDVVEAAIVEGVQE